MSSSGYDLLRGGVGVVSRASICIGEMLGHPEDLLTKYFLCPDIVQGVRVSINFSNRKIPRHID